MRLLRTEQKVEHHDKLEQLISDKVQKMYEEETSEDSMARYWMSYIDMVDIVIYECACVSYSKLESFSLIDVYDAALDEDLR